MKKITILFFLISIMLSGIAYAGFQGPGTQDIITTVKEANKMRDDSNVILTGNIIKQLRHEHYTFQDNTGTIEVEIDDDVWHGQQITPGTKVQIRGELDKDSNGTTIEVESIKIIKDIKGQGKRH